MWLRPSAVPGDDSTASSEKRRKRSGSKFAVRPRGCGSAARQSRRLGPEQAGPAMTWVRRGESARGPPGQGSGAVLRGLDAYSAQRPGGDASEPGAGRPRVHREPERLGPAGRRASLLVAREKEDAGCARARLRGTHTHLCTRAYTRAHTHAAVRTRVRMSLCARRHTHVHVHTGLSAAADQCVSLYSDAPLPSACCLGGCSVTVTYLFPSGKSAPRMESRLGGWRPNASGFHKCRSKSERLRQG